MRMSVTSMMGRWCRPQPVARMTSSSLSRDSLEGKDREEKRHGRRGAECGEPGRPKAHDHATGPGPPARSRNPQHPFDQEHEQGDQQREPQRGSSRSNSDWWGMLSDVPLVACTDTAEAGPTRSIRKATTEGKARLDDLSEQIHRLAVALTIHSDAVCFNAGGRARPACVCHGARNAPSPVRSNAIPTRLLPCR